MPIKTEAREAINTAAAETSFATFASSFISGLTKFTIASMAVFINSRTITMVMVIVKRIHSVGENFKNIARIMAMVATNR